MLSPCDLAGFPSSPAPDSAICTYRLWNSPHTRDQLAAHLGLIARCAGLLIRDTVRSGFKIYKKDDGSSCTDADLAAENCILQLLSDHFPHIPAISEERSSSTLPYNNRLLAEKVLFLVDPLDGTRDFINGGEEYTVNIAAIVNGFPIAGAVYAPAKDTLWIGGAHAYAAEYQSTSIHYPPVNVRQISVRQPSPRGLIALISHRHNDKNAEEFLKGLLIQEQRPVSSSMKFCMIAQGDADIYPRFGTTMEWDTAAGDAILRAAGGIVFDPKGKPLIYGRTQDNYVNGPFIAWGNATNIDTFCYQ